MAMSAAKSSEAEMGSKRTDIELAAAALEAARLADKELFEQRLLCERELRELGDRHEREIREAHEAERKLAQELLASENARHFDRLNHEAEQLKRMQVTYLPREVYDTQMEELKEKLTALLLFQSNLMGKLVVMGTIAVIVGGLIGGVLARVFFK
jgi:hypothetical protein